MLCSRYSIHRLYKSHRQWQLPETLPLTRDFATIGLKWPWMYDRTHQILASHTGFTTTDTTDNERK